MRKFTNTITIINSLIITLLISSCTVTTEFYLRSNNKNDIKMSMAFPKMKDMDSLIAKSSNWTSLYDMALEKEKSDSTGSLKRKLSDIPEDSIALFKKMFFRVTPENTQVNFEIKIDSIENINNYYNYLDKYKSIDGKANTSLNQSPQFIPVFWDGKSLSIHTGEMFKSDSAKNLSKGPDLGLSKKQKKALEKMNKALSEQKMIFKYRFVFENKIKSITGKHDLVKKASDNIIEIEYDLMEIMNSSKKKYKKGDDVIIIQTN